MDIQRILDYAQAHIIPPLKKNKRYYEGKNDILQKPMQENKPHNKLVNNYAKNIVNNTVGYWMGSSVSYQTEDENLKKLIEEVTNYNDDDFHNAALATDLSIYGVAYELVYLDADKKIRYNKLDVCNTYISYDNSFDSNINYVVRWYEDYNILEDKTTKYAEYYDAENIYYYADNGSGYALINTVPHFIGCVPVNVYRNNAECKGDFADVISLIDAYDTMQSESVNDFESTADAYLYLGNVDLDDGTIKSIRENKVIVGEVQPQWLTKNINDVYVENIKNRLDNDIFKFSNTINFSDENFGNNSSGISLKHKLMLFENRIASTQKLFEKSLLRRWEIICDFYNRIGLGSYDFSTIKFTFTRNLPYDLAENASAISMLKGTVSTETLLSQLPFIDDAKAELEKLQNEAEPFIFNDGGEVNDE